MNRKLCLPKMKLFVNGIILVSMLLAGCTFQSITIINDDGSGSYSTIISITEQEKSSFSSMNIDMQQFCDEFRSEVEKNNTEQTVTVRLEQQDDMDLCTVEIAFANLEELRQIYVQQGQVSVNRLELENNRLIYDVTLLGSSAQQNNPDDPVAELGSQLGGLLAGTIDATWEVMMPGTVEKDNADKIEGNVLIWQLDTTSQDRNMTAESTTGGTWFLYVILVLAAVLLIILGVILPGYLQTRKGSSLTMFEGQAASIEKYCKNCGTRLPDEGRFCPRCGTPRGGIQ